MVDINGLTAKYPEVAALYREIRRIERSDAIAEGIRDRQRSGTIKLGNHKSYGYLIDEQGNWTVNKNESVVIKLIFSLRNDGLSLRKIAAVLEELGAVTSTGNTHWDPSSISSILSNEIYIGHVVLGKTRIFEGKKVKNKVDQNKLLNHHEPIINEELFRRVQKPSK